MILIKWEKSNGVIYNHLQMKLLPSKEMSEMRVDSYVKEILDIDKF